MCHLGMMTRFISFQKIFPFHQLRPRLRADAPQTRREFDAIVKMNEIIIVLYALALAVEHLYVRITVTQAVFMNALLIQYLETKAIGARAHQIGD